MLPYCSFKFAFADEAPNRSFSPSHQEKQSQHVRLFHFHGWPEIGIPAEGKGMIDLIAAVQRQQQQSGNRPIIVHCRWGVIFYDLAARWKLDPIKRLFFSARSQRLTQTVPRSHLQPLPPDSLWVIFAGLHDFLMSVTINSSLCLSRPGVLRLNHLCDPL